MRQEDLRTHDLFLEELESAARARVDADILVRAAAQCFSLIEPWYKARSDIPEVEEVIRNVRRQGDKYVAALESSVDAAKRGSQFSQDFAALWRSLLNEDLSTQQILEAIPDLRRLAKRTQANVERAVLIFEGMQHSLLDVSNDIPDLIDGLEEKENLVKKRIEKAEKRSELLKIVKMCGIAGSAVVGGVAVLGFPPILIFLPIVLPLVTLIAEGTEHYVAKQAKERRELAKTFEEAIDQLLDAQKLLKELTDTSKKFYEYWIRVNVMLESVDDRIRGLRNAHGIRLQVEGISDSWSAVSESLLDYSTKIHILLSYDPMSSSRTRSTLSKSRGLQASWPICTRQRGNWAPKNLQKSAFTKTAEVQASGFLTFKVEGKQVDQRREARRDRSPLPLEHTSFKRLKSG